MVCDKAEWFHKNLKIKENVNVSQSKLFRFKTRHGIKQLDLQDEYLIGKLTIATLYSKEFNALLSKLNMYPLWV